MKGETVLIFQFPTQKKGRQKKENEKFNFKKKKE